MKIKSLVLAAALLMTASVAFAQETNRDANGKIQYGPYETNKFLDNWFITAGAGINQSYDHIFDGCPLETGLGLAVDVTLGKWVTPDWGFRLGWNGLSAGKVGTGEFGNAPFHYFHVDGLMNFSNLVAGYKEKRFINFVPYVSAGVVCGEKSWTDNRAFAFGGGLMMPMRLGSVVSIVPDVRFVGTKADVLFDGVALGGALTATLGLQFNLGKNNWTRKATTVAAAGAALAAAEAAKNALQAKNDKLAADAANAAAENDALKKENADLKNALANMPKDDAAMQELLAKPAAVYFEIGKAKLSVKEKAHLDYIVKNVIANGDNLKFTVSGNCDSKTGSKKRNQVLSEQRAKYVYDLLTGEYGLSADQFEVVANGGNDIFSTQELNRAVIIEKM